MISVIVPVYNMAHTLSRTIDSLLTQTYADYEILLVDDGSTDGSGDICDLYAKECPKIWVYHKPNGGLSSTRNYDMDYAKGDWVTFCDADDYVAPTWLQNYRLEEKADKTIICQGLTKFIQKSDDLCDIEFVKEHHGECNGELCDVVSTLFINGMLGWTVVKAIKERGVKFDTHHKYREDEKFQKEFLWPTDKLILYDAKGYFYLVGDVNKYDDWKCTPDFSRCEYENLIRLGFERGCGLRNYLANEYKDTLLKSFKTIGEDRAQLFRELTTVVREEGDNIGMFRPTKFLLRHDKTRLLSRAMLHLQLLLNR